jgi:hypothetical protein
MPVSIPILLAPSRLVVSGRTGNDKPDGASPGKNPLAIL